MINLENVRTAEESMRNAFSSLIGARACLEDESYSEKTRQVAATRMMISAMEMMRTTMNITEVEIGNGDAYVIATTGRSLLEGSGE